ncbi:hypothetical protein D1872_337960 [compost metagenome]
MGNDKSADLQGMWLNEWGYFKQEPIIPCAVSAKVFLSVEVEISLTDVTKAFAK